MKPEPDPQSGGKRFKPRRNFTKETRDEESMEKDLWDLDEPLESAPRAQDEAPEIKEITDPEPAKIPESQSPIPISPRSSRRDLTFKQSLGKKRPPHRSSAKNGGDPTTHELETAGEFQNRISASSTSDDTFADLEDSPDHPIEPEFVEYTEEEETIQRTAIDEKSDQLDDNEESSEPDGDIDKIAPAVPLSASVKVISQGLSKVERMGLIGFLVLILAGIIFFFANSLNKLPTDQKPLTPGDLPIAGKKISADKIRSYWREPNTAAGETARRGTLLLPVVELSTSGGPGAVRVFFRNSDGATVGDGVTRSVDGKTTVTIVATAGFEDQGMFAAYRTGETKPWKIEVFEGPSESAAGSEFKKLFEIPISTQRH